jgi:hypothetical protein
MKSLDPWPIQQAYTSSAQLGPENMSWPSVNPSPFQHDYFEEPFKESSK